MACQTSSAVQVLDPIRENYDNYLLIDVGSNMVNKKFSRDLESVLQRAKDSGKSYCFFSMTSIMLLQVVGIWLVVLHRKPCSHCFLHCHYSYSCLVVSQVFRRLSSLARHLKRVKKHCDWLEYIQEHYIPLQVFTYLHTDFVTDNALYV